MEYSSLLYEKYVEEMRNASIDSYLDKDAFTGYISKRFETMENLSLQEQTGAQGFVFFQCREDSGTKHCSVPVFGYYAKDVKSLIKLFQSLSDHVLTEEVCVFHIHLYEHDRESIDAFHMMQFGTIAEKCIKRLPDIDYDPEYFQDIRVLSKPDIERLWTKIWSRTNEIIEHLKKSSVYYPGTEFTEEVYRDFFMDEGTELIALFPTMIWSA